MKRILIALVILLGFAARGTAGDNEHISVNAGFLFPSTIDLTIGYEWMNQNGHALEVFGELGDHWRHPVCHNFWKGYYWDGGLVYKHQLKRLKNGTFRIFGGGHCGAWQTKVFFGIRAGFEYNYIFANNWEFSITQLNTVNFLHGDTFQNGLMIGVKIPL